MRWRRILISTLTLTGWLLAMIAIPNAWAKPPTPDTANPILLPFNYTDSHGISIDQYQLSLGQKWSLKNLIDPGDNATKWAVTLSWDIYRWWVGMAAFMLDFIISMPWVDAISEPIADFAATLKVDVIDHIGIIPLIMMLLACTVGYRWWRHGTGSAMSELAVGVLIVGFAGAFLTNPVTWVTDGPLQTAQRASITISNAAMTGTYTDPDDDKATSEIKAGTMLVDSLIRPVHSSINYGVEIDKHPCKDAYDQALKSPDASDSYTIREKVGKCDKTLGDHSKEGTFDQLFTLLVASVPMFQVSITLTVLAVVMMLALALLLWKSLMLIITTIFGILPGEGRASLVEDLAMIAFSLIYTITAMLALALGLRAVEGILQNQTLGLADRFILTTIIFVGIWTGLLVLFIAHVRKARAVARRVLPRQHGSKVPAAIRGFAHSAAGYAVGNKVSGRFGGASRAAPRSATAAATTAQSASGGTSRTAFAGGEADYTVARTLPPPKETPADTVPKDSPADTVPKDTPADTAPTSAPSDATDSTTEPVTHGDEPSSSPKMTKVKQRLGIALGVASLVATAAATGGTSVAARAGSMALKARRAHDLAARASGRVHARTTPPAANPSPAPTSDPPNPRVRDQPDNTSPKPAPAPKPTVGPHLHPQDSPNPPPGARPENPRNNNNDQPKTKPAPKDPPKPKPKPDGHNTRERIRNKARRLNTPGRGGAWGGPPPASRPNKKAS